MNGDVTHPVKQTKADNGDNRDLKSRRKKIVAFTKRHGLEIALGGAVFLLEGRCLYLERKNGRLLLDNIAKSARIESLTKLCDKKDVQFKQLMSDALKHGSSLAAHHMLDRKAYINQQ